VFPYYVSGCQIVLCCDTDVSQEDEIWEVFSEQTGRNLESRVPDSGWKTKFRVLSPGRSTPRNGFEPGRPRRSPPAKPTDVPSVVSGLATWSILLSRSFTFRPARRATYILGPSAEVASSRAINHGELARVDLTTQDWARVIDLVERYADLGLGTVDASIIAIAGRLEIEAIATLNRRDFATVRPSHAPAFECIH
jgi:hypothetical protein